LQKWHTIPSTFIPPSAAVCNYPSLFISASGIFADGKSFLVFQFFAWK
jgi:hypothetical protein